MSNESKISLRRRLQFGECQCPFCGCKGYQPAHRIDTLSRRLSHYGFRSVKCPKCSFRFFRWSLKPLKAPVEAEAKAVRHSRRHKARVVARRKAAMSHPTSLSSGVLGIILVVIGAAAMVVVFRNVPRVSAVSEHVVPESLTTIQVSLAFAEMESANRGFLLYGEPAYRAPYEVSRAKFSSGFQELVKLSRRDTTRLAHLGELKKNIDRWFQLYNPLIEARRHGAKADPGQLQSCRLEYEEIRDDLASLPGGAANLR